MTDRPVRLGDVVEDYCPRCRLLLNHDVASLVGGEVAKVTCRTCFNTHDFRKGDVPKRKPKKDDKKKLMEEVLQSMPVPPPAPPAPPPAPTEEAPAALPSRKRRDLWADLERIKKKG
jgi:Zn-finger nucleic acid-binding protein